MSAPESTPAVTEAQAFAALGFVLSLKPWGNDRVSRKVARYLDGDSSALNEAPALRAKLDEACATIRAALPADQR